MRGRKEGYINVTYRKDIYENISKRTEGMHTLYLYIIQKNIQKELHERTACNYERMQEES